VKNTWTTALFHQEGGVCHTTSLTPPRFIEVPLPCQESDFDIKFCSVSVVFLFLFSMLLTVLKQQCANCCTYLFLLHWYYTM